MGFNYVKSFESILYQGRNNDLKSIMLSRFSNTLNFFKEENLDRMIDELDLLANEVTKLTGIQTKLRFEETSTFMSIVHTAYSAHIDIRRLDGLSLFNSNYVNERMINAKPIEVDKVLAGSIDYKNNRVSGVFSEYPFVVTYSLAMFDGSLTVDELAAVLAHELGHAFTALSTLGFTIVTSAVTGGIEDVFERYATNEDVKIKVARSVVMSTNPNTREEIRPRKEILISHVLNNMDGLYKNYSGMDYLRIESLELLADQYANRLGLGKDLATAMMKLYRSSTLVGKLKLDARTHKYFSVLMSIVTLNTLGRVSVVDAVGKVSSKLSLFKTIRIVIYMNMVKVLFDNVHFKMRKGRHPDLEQRLQSVRADQIALLKHQTDKLERNLILKDLEVIDQSIKIYQSNKDVISPILTNLAGYISGMKRHENQRQSLQTRQNNPLYELTARLEQLT